MANRYAEIIGIREEDEIIHLTLRPAWRYYWKWYIAMLLLISLTVKSEIWMIGFCLSAMLFIAVIILRYRHLFTVTSKRVISRIGLIARNTNEIEIRHTRELSVKQGIVERILNYGNVEISSAASTGVEVMFIGITWPHDLKEAIRRVRDGL